MGRSRKQAGMEIGRARKGKEKYRQPSRQMKKKIVKRIN